jgi:hypothetical protein
VYMYSVSYPNKAVLPDHSVVGFCRCRFDPRQVLERKHHAYVFIEEMRAGIKFQPIIVATAMVCFCPPYLPVLISRVAR